MHGTVHQIRDLAKRVIHRLRLGVDSRRSWAQGRGVPIGGGVVAEQRGIDLDDVRWMRRDLAVSLLGIEWFANDVPDRVGRTARAVVRAMGWTEDRLDLAEAVLREAVAELSESASWSDVATRVVELAESAG